MTELEVQVTTIDLDESEQLRQSREEFRLAFDHAPIGMAIVGLDGGFLQANAAMSRITGYNAAELCQLTFQDITHPEDIDDDIALMTNLVTGPNEFYEMDKRYIRKDGSEVWIHLTGNLVRNTEGEPLHFISQVQDVTERKQREQDVYRMSQDLERANRDLVRSNLALSDFAAVVAHDLKSPLQAFYLNADRLADTSLDAEQQRLITRITDATDWMGKLVDGVLSYCQVDRPPVYDTIDCKEIVARVLVDLEAQILNSAAVISVAELPQLRADSVQIQRLMQNLIDNSLKWPQPGGVPEICIEWERTANGHKFTVTDKGVGIPKGRRADVFRMFNQSAPDNTRFGHGVGLASCRNIVERHGGQIWLDESSVGTKVCFSLPE